jgi:hypothetical protein
MTNFYYYNAFGLKIKSSIIFPELISGQCNSDIIIHSEGYESLHHKLSKTKKKGFSEIFYSSNDVLYLIDNEPLFRVISGKEIIVNPIVNIDMSFLRHLILGPGIGTLLLQKGHLVLHASAVNVEGRGVVFLGWGGDGKSTIAAAMNNRGYQFITDDVLTIKFSKDNEPVAVPSFPRVKLWDDVIKYMTDQPELIRKIHPEIEKYSLKVDDRFSLESLPLKMIYVLENSQNTTITVLKPQDALMELIKSSYALNLFGETGKSRNLFQCANLVKNVPVKLLKKRQSLKELEDLIRIVEEDVLISN